MDKPNESVNRTIILTRSLYLRSVAVIYLFAFISLFFQIQGLWGDEGILPAKILFDKLRETHKENANFFNMPTIFWFSNYIQEFINKIFPDLMESSSSIENSMYLLCLIAIFISLSIVINWSIFYNMVGFFILWAIYLSFFLIGQVFMSYQWDIFLLEVGFLTFIFAPLYKNNLNYISPVDNSVYYLLRYLMFRFIYSNGIVKVTSNCPTWKSFTTLNYHFQSQPIPTVFSWYAHFLPEALLKILTALTFYIEIYVPFMFFSIFIRRLNIFAGLMQFFLQVGIILTGNYNFFNLLTLVLNISNFDDYFFRTMIPRKLLEIFELDPCINKTASNIENTNQKSTINGSDNEPELNGENDINEKNILEILKNKNLRKINDDNNIETSIFSECLINMNFLCVSILITFFYIYPLKDLIPGNLYITPKHIGLCYDNVFMNIYVLFIFIYILFKSISGHIVEINYGVNNAVSNTVTKTVIHQLFVIIKSFKFIPFIIFLFAYYIHATSVFFKSVDLTLPSKSFIGKYIDEGVKVTDLLFSRFRICHGYGLFRVMTGVGYRPELEIKIDINGNFETLNFIYKMDEKKSLKFNIPHQPRIDWQIWFSSLAKDVNSEGWMIIMLGKVLEKNPVILDLLGYHIDEKSSYYKYSLWDRIMKLLYGDRPLMKGIPKSIKVESYKYYFNNRYEYQITNKIWKKAYIKDFLPIIKKDNLNQIFKVYNLPELNENRFIQINQFQKIPIIDIVIIIMFMKLLRLVI